MGEIGLEGSVLIIRRISVRYKLRASKDQAKTIERVHSLHAERCPVARSIQPAIEVKTSLEILSP